MTKKSMPKLKYLGNVKSFWGEIKLLTVTTTMAIV